ncbi:MAG: hypothetical protein JXB00_03550 [Bacteroidales bacterium]|nr:hypothetical protein [Bacteroidales bacterium]
MFKIKYLIILFGLLAFGGCKSDPASKKSTGDDFEAAAIDSLRQEFKEVYYRFPSPEEMFSYLDSTGLQFNKGLLNPYANIDSYIETFYQSLNMGIYNADLAYISLFQRYKESLDYLQTIYILSERLRISEAFNKNLVFRIENNIRNNDSLEVISDDAFNGIINFLSKNKKEDVFALISMGGFIEFMHLSLSLCGEYSPENKVIQKIADQKLVFNNILKFAHQYSNERNIQKMIGLVEPLTQFYNKVQEETGKATVTKAPEGKLVFGAKKKSMLSENDFYKLKELISDIRIKITTAK